MRNLPLRTLLRSSGSPSRRSSKGLRPLTTVRMKTMVNKLPVLVTGGAGYIGSHAMLALKDAGWSVSVIDDLSNGARSAVPGDVPFYEGDIADGALVGRIFAEQGIQAIM